MTKQKAEKKKDREQKKSIGVRKEEIVRSIKATEKFITIRDTGELLYFNPSDGQWYDGTTYVEQFTRDKAGVDYSTSLLREVRETLRVDTYTDGKSFISPPEWVNLKNGALNVLTSEFIPRDPEPKYDEENKKIDDLKEEREKDEGKIKATTADDYQRAMEKLDGKYDPLIKEVKETIKGKKAEWKQSQTQKFAKFCFTSGIPVKYNPSARCTRIDAFFKSMELGDDTVQGIMELFGYCLLKSYPIKKMFLFVGPHDTGKSTIMSLLEALLGAENYSSLSLDAMQEDHFEKYKLYHMYANISGELANRFIKDTSLLKELLGSDSVSVRLMFSQKKFNFWNYAKLIFLANQIPATYETDNDFFPKVLIFEFTKQFKEGEEGTRPKEELMAELTTEEEISGLLNKAVVALQELLKRGKFKTTKSEQENKELYLIKSNPFRYYIDNVLCFNNGVDQIYDPDGNLVRAYKQDVYANFVTFCRRYNITGWTDNKFFRLMKKYAKEEGIPEKRDTDGVWYYSGVSIRNLFPETENSGSDSDIDDL